MSKITAIVMEFSPVGVCALLADSVGAYGLKIFGPLGKLILTVYASDVILVCLMYIPMVAILARFPIGQFFKGIWKVWVVTLSTTSSAGSLPISTSAGHYHRGDHVASDIKGGVCHVNQTEDTGDHAHNLQGQAHIG